MGDYKTNKDTSCRLRRSLFHSHVLIFNDDPMYPTGSNYETNEVADVGNGIFPVVFPVHVETERTASYYISQQHGRGTPLPHLQSHVPQSHNNLPVDAVSVGEVGINNVEIFE
jgi:hypothetical protein